MDCWNHPVESFINPAYIWIFITLLKFWPASKSSVLAFCNSFHVKLARLSQENDCKMAKQEQKKEEEEYLAANEAGFNIQNR